MGMACYQKFSFYKGLARDCTRDLIEETSLDV